MTGQEIVSPEAVQVLDDKGDNELTLTACHPKYSASKRIVIHAQLEGTPVAAAPKAARARAAEAPKQLNANVSGEAAPKLPADPLRAAVRRHLGARVAGRQALAQVAGVPDRPADLPDRALLLLRKLLPTPARQLLTCDRRRRSLAWDWCSRPAPARTIEPTTTQPLDPFATKARRVRRPQAPPHRHRPPSTSASASTPTSSQQAPRSISRQRASSTAPDRTSTRCTRSWRKRRIRPRRIPATTCSLRSPTTSCLAAFSGYTGSTTARRTTTSRTRVRTRRRGTEVSAA